MDDFLLSKLQYYEKYGDAVFLKTPKLLNTSKNINRAVADSSNIQLEYNTLKRILIEDDELFMAKRPYVGVTEFLSGQTNSNTGKLYFPEFREESYWTNRYDQWSQGFYTDDEINVFFNGNASLASKVDLGDPNSWKDDRGVFKPIDEIGTDELKRLRKLMEDKWKAQALLGTDVHNILQYYFSQNLNGLHKFDWLDGLKNESDIEKFKNKYLNYTLADGTVRSKIPELMKLPECNRIILQTLKYAKELRLHLVSKYASGSDEELMFYPEVTMSSKLNKTYEGRDDLSILGRIDLLVVGSDGTPHIIDFKTSPKHYEDYSTAKALGFTYLLNTYERMLRRYGCLTEKTDLMIAPILFDNFKLVNGHWLFDGIKLGSYDQNGYTLRLTSSEKNLSQNLDDFIEAPLIIDGTSNNVIEEVDKVMKKWFPKYGDTKTLTDDEIKKMINDLKGFEKNSETGRYEFKPKGWGKNEYIYADSETALFNKVKQYYQGNKDRTIKKTNEIAKALLEGLTSNSDLINLPKGTDDWVRLKLSKYCNENWEVLENDAADAARKFGMILLYNRDEDVMDIVKVTGKNLMYEHNWGQNRSNLTGALEYDIQEDLKSDSLMLKAYTGNIELMEAMLVLNRLSFNKDINIGRIDVIGINYNHAEGTYASNKELLYNWNKLNLLVKVTGDDNYRNGKIHLKTDTENFYSEFLEILRRTDSNIQYGYLKGFKPALEKLHNAITVSNRQSALLALNELRVKLEKLREISRDLKTNGQNIHVGLQSYDSDYIRILYLKVNAAILLLNGIDIRQQLKDHANDIEHMNILVKGLSSNYLDNAKNFSNHILNLVTSIALDAGQNARENAEPKMKKLRMLVEKLKKEQGFAGIKEHTYGNQTTLYKDMTYFDLRTGDLLFVNPWKSNSLSSTLKEFLKYVISEIYRNQYGDVSDTAIELLAKVDSDELFRVPLMESTMASQINVDGWITWIKNKVRMFRSKKNFKEWLERKESQFLTESGERSSKLNTDIFHVTNTMNEGNGPKRLDIIKDQRGKYGDGFYERDLERILMHHIWAYSTTEAFESRMPLLRAAFISLAVAGNNANAYFENDEKFFKDWIANKVRKESIVPEKYKWVKGAVGLVQAAASWMALAFSPVQMTYQALEGIYKDIKLMITKPDGTEAFTFKNMKEAAGVVYQELFHMSDKPTVCSAINSFYGINDMDAASYADNNSSNNHGIWNLFGKIAYKFSTRPDFYNRMTIFVTQMKADDCFDAHSVGENGELLYDWKKDKRFAAYANNNKSNMEEYNKARALYYATAELFVKEGVKKKDGTLFKVGDALPKAYSNLESEARKSVGDSLYGYYDSTKKSLFQATLLGGIFMLMRTYWSSKKNQYFAPGGIKALGKWEVLTDANGNELYYANNENGEIDTNAPLVTKDDPKCSGTKFLTWKGRYEEGVMLTLTDLIVQSVKNGPIDGWKAKMSGDPQLTEVYKQNLKLFGADLIGALLFGSLLVGLLKDLADDSNKEAKKNPTSGNALNATALNLVYLTAKNASLDFNFVKSLFDFTMDTNPFVVSYIGNLAKIGTDAITGELDGYKVLTKSLSAARQIRPFFNYLDAD